MSRANYLPNGELTIYKAVDETSNIALDENSDPVIRRR